MLGLWTLPRNHMHWQRLNPEGDRLTARMQDLVSKQGDLVGGDHPLPAIAEVALSLTCSFPSSIALIVDEPGYPVTQIAA
ncbi:unnamed protein product [Dovyalis caffra]|uniref:Uncharacterized protein n=1 Tax=Dovyalis caffra TaxID=77055 RepID=A0AAV1R9T4_9ROSI|nr:unnamed protein product [Dovyalis caffra]